MQTFLQRLRLGTRIFVAVGNVAVMVAAANVPAAVVADVPVSVATPKPKATASPAPNRVLLSGYERNFYFARQNASGYPKGIGQINQAAFEAALNVHAAYTLPSTPWTLGATYVYANPLGANGACANVSQYGPGGGCQQYPKTVNTYKATDTTLPGFPIATLAEAYVQYKTHLFNVKVGDQLFTTPWANPSDTRVKPAYYQGIDAHYTFAPGWSVGVSRIMAWESRSASDFNESTLITLNANGTFNPTPGFLLGNVTYTRGTNVSADANYYEFYNIANLLWVEGKLYFYGNSPIKPYIAAHVGTENSNGTALAGLVTASLVGLQGGANLGNNVNLTAGFDILPVRSQTLVLPKGVTCSASSHEISGNVGYFLPTSGTPNCLRGAPGTATIYYGGIASPYTDGYTSDPSFTTSISQGLMERQSPGDAVKLIGTYQSTNRKFKAIVSRAFYNYTNPAGSENTYETDLDGTYFFNKVTSGPYHGLEFRDRYMERTQSNTVQFGGSPLFKANRVQLEYDF